MRGMAPRDSCAFSALRLPLFFWRQKLRGFGRQNSGARASRELERASLALPRRSQLLLPACGEKDGLRGPLRDSELTGSVMAVQR
jgi:hypothetical protein